MPDSRKSFLGMKWYKFLIYFSLFASALLNLLYGITYLTGGIYEATTDGEITAEMVYGYYGVPLKIVDVIFGLVLIALAIFSLIVRRKLANFDYTAPKCLYILYIVVGGGQLLFVIATSIITKVAIDLTEIIKVLIVFVFLFANRRYFKNRAHLFSPDIPAELTKKSVGLTTEAVKETVADPTPTVTQQDPHRLTPITTITDHPQITEFCLSKADEEPKTYGTFDVRGKDFVVFKEPDVVNDIFGDILKKDPPRDSADSSPEKQTPEIRFCRKCGSHLVLNSRFCTQCGTEIQKG